MRPRESLDWETFSGSGFRGRDTVLEMDLAFDPTVNDNLSKAGSSSPNHHGEIVRKAKMLDKALPPFNYDITPKEERSIQLDKHFLEVFL